MAALLRIYAAMLEDSSKQIQPRAKELKSREQEAGYGRLDHYLSFSSKVEGVKRTLLSFLISAKHEGKRVVGYGAPAKGNTLLNYCGVRTDFVDYTVDRSPHKQGHFLPGVHIPIYAPEQIRQTRPDYVLILPWNLREEVMQQMSYIREWGGKFVVPIPEVQSVSMIFTETSLKGAFIIDPEPVHDERGMFARTWCQREFEAQGLKVTWVQNNISVNRHKGTFRGMHYQVAPYEEVKLVRCTMGAIYDVIVDLRPESPTYCQYAGMIAIGRKSSRSLYPTTSLRHGFLTLSDESEVSYHMSDFYEPVLSARIPMG